MTERSVERQRALRAGWLGDMAAHTAYPPCSRHDDDADDRAERVKLAFAYAMGLLRSRERAAEASELILRLHDHKGDLHVLCVRPLPGEMRRALRRAWREMGAEAAENVTFELPDSPAWASTWEARRFEDPEPVGESEAEAEVVEEPDRDADRVYVAF